MSYSFFLSLSLSLTHTYTDISTRTHISKIVLTKYDLDLAFVGHMTSRSYVWNTHTFIHTHTHTHTLIHTHTHTYTHPYTHTYTYTHVRCIVDCNEPGPKFDRKWKVALRLPLLQHHGHWRRYNNYKDSTIVIRFNDN